MKRFHSNILGLKIGLFAIATALIGWDLLTIGLVVFGAVVTILEDS